MRWLIVYHRFTSFTMYIIGFVWFVLSLKKRYYMRQFSLFAWTHVALLIVVTQSYLIIINIFHGMIWFIVPVSMIVINDVMAYMFGFFFGKTPLIQLSPKKTWEGFIGGGFSTIVMGMLVSKGNFYVLYIVMNGNYRWECLVHVYWDNILNVTFQVLMFMMCITVSVETHFKTQKTV